MMLQEKHDAGDVRKWPMEARTLRALSLHWGGNVLGDAEYHGLWKHYDRKKNPQGGNDSLVFKASIKELYYIIVRQSKIKNIMYIITLPRNIITQSPKIKPPEHRVGHFLA